MATPAEISMALHYWVSPSAYRDDDSNPTDLHQLFVKRGFLERRSVISDYGSWYKPTEALGVWVEALCAVPSPVQRWVIPSEAV